jgi:hypothetical protein
MTTPVVLGIVSLVMIAAMSLTQSEAMSPVALRTATDVCEPVIRTTYHGNGLVVEGSCYAADVDHHNGDYSYELIVERSGAAGTSRTRQEGSFMPGSPSADTLGTTRVNYAAGDRLYARLFIRLDGETIARTEIRRVIE